MNLENIPMSSGVHERAEPTTVAEGDVFYLDQIRKARFDVDSTERSAACADGVCVVDWRPRKPSTDVA